MGLGEPNESMVLCLMYEERGRVKENSRRQDVEASTKQTVFMLAKSCFRRKRISGKSSCRLLVSRGVDDAFQSMPFEARLGI